MPVMETIPNHVMMMTGVRPDRSGVPANSIYDRALGEVRDMDQPTDIKVPTVIERLNARGYTTGTVLSKEYLVGVFGERATHRWEPELYIPVSGHAPDLLTYNALTSMVDELDPHLVFVPATVLLLTVVSFNVLGDRVRRRFDVRGSAL